jgi:hypothetical protein
MHRRKIKVSQIVACSFCGEWGRIDAFSVPCKDGKPIRRDTASEPLANSVDLAIVDAAYGIFIKKLIVGRLGILSPADGAEHFRRVLEKRLTAVVPSTLLLNCSIGSDFGDVIRKRQPS